MSIWYPQIRTCQVVRVSYQKSLAIQNTVCLLSQTGPLITEPCHRYGRQIVISYNQKAVRVYISALHWLRVLTDHSGHVQISTHLCLFPHFEHIGLARYLS